MKALSLWQPWASLVALGVKTIETRSWSTSYRGTLAIHAAATLAGLHAIEFDYEDGWQIGMLDGDEHRSYHWQRIDGQPVVTMYEGSDGPTLLPLGAVVATCTLVDIRPTEDIEWGRGSPQPGWARVRDVVWANEIERPYGDFTPGRFAWLLDDIKPTTERCPACLGRGGTLGSHADLTGAQLNDGGAEAAFVITERCKVCDLACVCDPIPAKGRQQLWEWAASGSGEP